MYLWHYFSTFLVARYQFFEQKTKIAKRKKKNGWNKRWKNHFERERENRTLKTFFELQESPSLSFLFIILSRSFVFVKVWSVKKYSSNNRLLKKKLPRYIVGKETKKKRKKRRTKGKNRSKEGKSLKGIFGKTNSLAFEKVALVQGIETKVRA